MNAHNPYSPDRSTRAVVVVGASADRAKYGNRAVRAYAEAGYTVWPVNPKGGEIEGLPVYRNVEELPGLPHRASVYLHEDEALATLDALADLEGRVGRRITAVYLNPGVETPAVEARATELGLKAVYACSIRAIGRDPEEFAP